MEVSENITAISPGPVTYYGAENIISFGLAYSKVHGYIASVICIIGIPVNVINAFVLTRSKMLTSCNLILAAMATSDVITMVIYLPFALHFYCIHGPDSSVERNTLSAARYMLFFACFSIVAHSSSIWLTVALGMFRYTAIHKCRRDNHFQSLRRAKVVVTSVYLVTFLMCIPNFFSMTIKGHPKEGLGVIWVIRFRSENFLQKLVYRINFWVQAIVMKILPGLILFVIILLLVHTLRAVSHARKKYPMEKAVRLSPSEIRRIKQTNRPTRLLIAILILYFITEVPQGVILLLSGTLPKFLEEIYNPLGDFMDILTLSNNNVTFILYCAMSKRFQMAIKELFCYFCHQTHDDALKRRSSNENNNGNKRNHRSSFV